MTKIDYHAAALDDLVCAEQAPTARMRLRFLAAAQVYATLAVAEQMERMSRLTDKPRVFYLVGRDYGRHDPSFVCTENGEARNFGAIGPANDHAHAFSTPTDRLKVYVLTEVHI